jgi:hypothetical protein
VSRMTEGGRNREALRQGPAVLRCASAVALDGSVNEFLAQEAKSVRAEIPQTQDVVAIEL